MAGRKHHFIQQLLLKGFSYDYPRKPCHIWVYRRDGKTFAPATEGYGAERDFYGSPEDTSLDDSITELEATRFDSLITGLRSGSDREVDPREATAFTIHLLSRAKNLRSMLEQGVSQIMAFARPSLFDDTVRQGVVLSEFRRNPQLIIDQLRNGGIPEDVAVMIQQNIEPHLPSLVALFTNTQRHVIDTFMETFLASVEHLIAEGQRNMLKKRLNDFSGTRAEELAALNWARRSVSSAVVLGDSVVFAELADGTFKPATEPGDSLVAVWLPVSSTQILVGSPQATPAVDATRLCEGAARCSFDSFCAANGPDMHNSLVPLIRTRTFALDDASAKRMAEESLAKLI